MKIIAELPTDRTLEGRGWAEDDRGNVVIGPFRCRGKADNQMAVAHHNAVRDPEQAYGDHPSGTYNVVSVHNSMDAELQHYGKFFILLDPTGGDALIAKQNGRSGIALHGGAPLPDGTLRPTYGCNRLENNADDSLGPAVRAEFDANRTATYECRDV